MAFTRSWHIPQAKDDDGIPLIFMQITSKAARDEIESRITAGDQEYSTLLQERSGLVFGDLKFTAYPYIRDNLLTPEHACVLLQRVQERHPGVSTAVLLDSEEDNQSCILVEWYNESDDQRFRVTAARVDQTMAQPIINLLSRSRLSIQSILGKAEYETARIDLSLGYNGGPVYPNNFQTRVKVPESWTLCKPDVLNIMPLLPLDLATREALCKKILPTASTQTIPLNILEPLQLPEVSRADIHDILEQLDSRMLKDDIIRFKFFIDSILQDDEGLPIIVVVSKGSFLWDLEISDQLEVMPLKTEKLARLCRSLASGWDEIYNNEDNVFHRPDSSPIVRSDFHLQAVVPWAVTDKCAEHLATERVLHPCAVYPPASPFYNSQGLGDPVSIWFLCDFSIHEQRKLRGLFAKPASLDPPWLETTYTYIGYQFPGNSRETQTIEDLIQLWQKSDPHSPFYDSAFSDLQLNSYPRCFIAVDGRVLSDERPVVILAHTLSIALDGHYLGWTYGTIDAGGAFEACAKFLSGDTEPYALMGNADIVWLGDLTHFQAKYDDGSYIDDH